MEHKWGAVGQQKSQGAGERLHEQLGASVEETIFATLAPPPEQCTAAIMKYLVLTMRKPQFDPSFVPDHYAFLQSLRDRQVLEQAGPFTDKSGGAYVIRSESLESAREIAGQDPLKLHDCSEVTVREWDAR